MQSSTDTTTQSSVRYAQDIIDWQEMERHVLGRSEDRSKRSKDSGKVQWSLLPWELLTPIARVFSFGARKHSPNGWKYETDPIDLYFDAFCRHMDAWRRGETVDPDTGEHPLAHALTDLLIIFWHVRR
jgi:hypothetical protein